MMAGKPANAGFSIWPVETTGGANDGWVGTASSVAPRTSGWGSGTTVSPTGVGAVSTTGVGITTGFGVGATATLAGFVVFLTIAGCGVTVFGFVGPGVGVR